MQIEIFLLPELVFQLFYWDVPVLACTLGKNKQYSHGQSGMSSMGDEQLRSSRTANSNLKEAIDFYNFSAQAIERQRINFMINSSKITHETNL